MSEGIRTANIPSGILTELLGHQDLGGGVLKTARMPLDLFVALVRDVAAADPSGVAGVLTKVTDLGNKLTGEITDRSSDTASLQKQIADAGTAIIAVQALAKGASDGAATLQQQIVTQGRAVIDIDTRLVQTKAVVDGNTAGIGVLQKQIVAISEAIVDQTSGLGAKLSLGDSDAAAPSDRPGEARLYFTTSLAGGDPSGLAAPDPSLCSSGNNGRVLRLTGTSVVARRRLEPIEAGRSYLTRVAVRRRVNGSDPSNDGVRVAVAWYDQNRLPLVGSTARTIITDMLDLTVGRGRQQAGAIVSTAGVTASVKPPAGACYARLFVQFFGTDHVTDLEVMAWRDVTDSQVYSPDLTAFTGRLTAIESGAYGDRIGLLEQNAAAPLSSGFSSAAAAAAGTVPAAVTMLDILGFSDAGDGAGARYKRAAYQPTHPWAVRSKDGSWFEQQGRRTLEQIGGKGDGATDNRPILLKVAAGSMVNIDAPGTYRFAAGPLGGAGSILSAGPGVRFASPQGTGALNFAKGSRFEAWHEGADGQVRYFGHRPTGPRAIGTGALDAGFSAASWMFDVRDDDSDVGSSFRNGTAFRHIITGGKGGVQALYASCFFKGTTGAHFNPNYTAGQFSYYQQAPDGGYPNSDPNVNGGKNVYRGAGFGLGAACYTDPQATFLLNQTAAEFNVFGAAYNAAIGGPSVSIWTNVQAVSARATRGIDVDIGYVLGSQGTNQQYGPEVGWRYGWGVTDVFGGIPLAPDSAIFGSEWKYRTTPLAVRAFADLTGFSFSDAVLKTNHMRLNEGALLFDDKQVIGKRQAAVANATDAASAVTQLNALLVAMRTHGLIAS